jgi:hypothetical protein
MALVGVRTRTRVTSIITLTVVVCAVTIDPVFMALANSIIASICIGYTDITIPCPRSSTAIANRITEALIESIAANTSPAEIRVTNAESSCIISMCIFNTLHTIGGININTDAVMTKLITDTLPY